jgi:predicted PurR-regulated permease PerM
MSAADVSRTGRDDRRQRELAVFISIRTILLVGVAVALAWALASIGHVLLLIFVAVFNAAVLAPVVAAMSRRLPWSRGLCSSVLVLGIVVVTGVVPAILLAPIVDGVRGFSHNVPRLVDEARHSSLGRSIDGGSHGPEVLQKHAGDIVGGVKRASGGLAHVGVSAFGVLTLAVSVTFMTLFLPDRPPPRPVRDRRPALPRQPGALRADHRADHRHHLALHARQPDDLADLRHHLMESRR